MRFARFPVALLLAVFLCHPGAARAAGARDGTLTPPPSTVYAGVSNAGMFKDTGPTDSWTGLTALPSSSNALALATGDSAHWRDAYAGLDGGIYATHDGGSAWTTGLAGHAVRALLVTAGSAHVFAGAERLYRSDDGGKTWAYGGIAQPVTALAQASGSSLIYAAGVGRAWVSRDAGNGGQRWTSLRRGLPSDLSINSLAVSGAVVYAATSQGVWQEINRTWMPLPGLAAKAVTGIVVDAGRVIALAADDGLYTSSDGGQTWSARPIRDLAGPVTALAQDPQQPDMLVIGDKTGAAHWSKDGGQTWSALGGAVAGNDGNPIRAVATVQRVSLPVDAVPDPKDGTRYVYANGHTLTGAFLDYWQGHQEALGQPETQAFPDPTRGNARVQYFQNMEIVQTSDGVSPTPLGIEQQIGGVAVRTGYPVDAHFRTYYDTHGGLAVFGPPVSPLLTRPAGDGTGRSYLVQYFRNARLDYRALPDGSAKVVRPGALGDQALQSLGWL